MIVHGLVLGQIHLMDIFLFAINIVTKNQKGKIIEIVEQSIKSEIILSKNLF